MNDDKRKESDDGLTGINNRQRILALVLTFALSAGFAFILTGCWGGHSEPARSSSTGTTDSQTIDEGVEEEESVQRFYAPDSSDKSDLRFIDRTQVIVDNDTGVEYLHTWRKTGSFSGSSTMVMLVNADGTPKINEEWLENNSDE